MMDINIKFQPPSKTSPGYLRRMRKAIEFGNALSSGNTTPEILDELVNWLADYVVEPTGAAAVEALWEASEEQFLALIEVIKGSSSEATIPPQNAAP